jgi:hypothetical protein
MAARVSLTIDLRPTPAKAGVFFFVFFLFGLAPECGSQLEDVTLKTYYPATTGVYQQLLTFGNAYLAVNNTGNSFVEVGGTDGSASGAMLVVRNGSVGIGTPYSGSGVPSYYFTQPGAGGLRVGPNYPTGSGSAQIELDEINTTLTNAANPTPVPYPQAGQINRINGSGELQLWSTYKVSLGAGTPYSDTLHFIGAQTPAGNTLGVMVAYGSMTVSGQIAAEGVFYTDPGVPYMGNVPYNCFLFSGLQCPPPQNGSQNQVVAIAGGGNCGPGYVEVANGPAAGLPNSGPGQTNPLNYKAPDSLVTPPAYPPQLNVPTLTYPTAWNFTCGDIFHPTYTAPSNTWVECCDL